MTTEKSTEHKKDIWLSSYAIFILLGEIVWSNAFQLFNEMYMQSVAERKVCSNLNLWMNELILIGNNGLVTKHALIVLITFSFVRTYIYVIPFIISVSRQQTVTKRKWIYFKRFLKQLKKNWKFMEIQAWSSKLELPMSWTKRGFFIKVVDNINLHVFYL